MQERLRKILPQLKSDADWIGLRSVEELSEFYAVKNGVVENVVSSQDNGVMVSILSKGQFLYGATNLVTLESIQKVVDLLQNKAKQLSPKNLHTFTAAQRPKATGEYINHNKLDKLSKAEILDRLISVNKRLKISEKIINAVTMLCFIESKSHFVSSNGSDYGQHIDLTYHKFEATAAEGTEIQSRSNGMPTYQADPSYLLTDAFIQQAEQVGQEAIQLAMAETCPTDTMDMILMPDQLYLQVHESIGHPLELDRILGDERNYAGWSFIKQSDFGNLQYGSPLLNVTFDPHLDKEFASYQYDDCGNEAKKEYLIKEGKLLRALGSLESQERSGVPGVSNFRSSSWNRAPIDRMANINIEPGTSSLDEMIASVKRGILMKTNRSWSIDDYRNKFQFGCEYGQLIEEGKLTKVVKKPNYKGITTPFWNNLKMVGNSSTFELWGSPFCGKGEPNQVIRVGHAVPACLFGNVEVFGGV